MDKEVLLQVVRRLRAFLFCALRPALCLSGGVKFPLTNKQLARQPSDKAGMFDKGAAVTSFAKTKKKNTKKGSEGNGPGLGLVMASTMLKLKLGPWRWLVRLAGIVILAAA